MSKKTGGASIRARQGLAVLLGAGFSEWAAGLPIPSELFDFAVQPFGTRETSRLAPIGCHPPGLGFSRDTRDNKGVTTDRVATSTTVTSEFRV